MRNRFFFILGLVFLALVSAVFYYSPYQVATSEMFLTVSGENVGINVDTDAVWFGEVPAGGSSTRSLNLSVSRSSKILIKSRGDLVKWVSVSRNNFKLPAGASEEISITAQIPENAELGKYSGAVSFYFFRD